MTRVAAVLVRQSMAAGAPDGVDPRRWLEAVAEDTYEVVAGLELVTPVLVTSVAGLDEIVWPGTEVVVIDEDEPLKNVVQRLKGDQAVVVSGDAPDLPPLLVGKLFRELGRAEISVCPDERGGAVALACGLPMPAWADPDLDASDLVAELRAQAPGRRMVAAVPGWHRVRDREDLSRLDPGLEGWDNTRALLG
ncbi:DUF2064 domain-containing protein [Nonomuraea muscovyensis]|uniref:DUF2064 domain-containing protein n=1 Tax=Nonomuraea muscovyensis TaxID=1124761 RepID=A0A7X0EXN0_9ACTN|nr:hypothetical protein [Nonomuraea muscovyensis]MBB6344826.1 hypothetical protein [Nonomuraea muscovyensis]MDF2711183.1 hypothetical protein [Nonomuraea muscovyensis]